MSFEIILPFLRPIEHLILDETISEIMVNSGSSVYIEKDGLLKEVKDVQIQESALLTAVRAIARTMGSDISEEQPILDSRLPDGSRIAAVLPPCSVNGITLTIRKFNTRHFTIDDLLTAGTLTDEMADQLKTAVQSRKNILISGGTGTGKTTLLNILADFIPDEERIIVIEDTAEIYLRKPHVVRLEARKKQEGRTEITIADLLKATLRHRPDRILLGEVRGGEAFDLLQALNTGHSGSLSTIHANSTEQALSRFANCVLQSGIQLPYNTVKAQIGDAVNVVVHLERMGGKRRIAVIMEVACYQPETDQYQPANPKYS